ncbi:MAG: hypothetical protein V4614_03175 [Pseudomonadota bacterium]
MIVRFNIDSAGQSQFDYRVTHEGEEIYGDTGLASLEDCVNAALDGLGSDATAVEIAYRGIISGTYPLASLALMTEQIALHALQTTAAVEEVLR